MPESTPKPGRRLTLAELRELPPKVEGCAECEQYGVTGGPGHWGMPSCRSGSLASGGNRPHCTCDGCF